MAEEEDRGKALLQMLHGDFQQMPLSSVQAPRASAGSPSSSSFQIPPLDRATAPTSRSTPTASVPMSSTDVRSVTAGEQHEPETSAQDDLHPGALGATPARSAGAELLRMLHTPPQPVETSTSGVASSVRLQNQPLYQRQDQQQQQDQRYYQQHQQQHQQQHHHSHNHHNRHHHEHLTAVRAPTPVRQSVAAEQERVLKAFLAIGGNDENTRTMSNDDVTDTWPISPPTSSEAVDGASPPSSALATPSRTEDAGTKGHVIEGRKRERGKGRSHREGKGRGSLGDVGSHVPECAAPRERRKQTTKAGGCCAKTLGRGREGHQGRGSRSHGGAGRAEKKGSRGGTKKGAGVGGGGGGGGGRGGKGLVSSPKYAWSAFQNSPDPKSIPIPSLDHFSLNHGPDDAAVEEKGAMGASPLIWQEGTAGLKGMDAYVAGARSGLQTPPRAAATMEKSGGESRSSAKMAEDDIKRILRLG